MEVDGLGKLAAGVSRGRFFRATDFKVRCGHKKPHTETLDMSQCASKRATLQTRCTEVLDRMLCHAAAARDNASSAEQDPGSIDASTPPCINTSN